MDKMTTFLVEDLHNILEDNAKGLASISCHSLSKTTGNVWAIRGQKKNFVVLLLYENEQKLEEQDATNDAIVVKEEQEENITDLETKDVNESTCQSTRPSTLHSVAFRETSCDEVGVTVDTHTSVVENAIDDYMNSEQYAVTHERILPKRTFHQNCQLVPHLMNESTIKSSPNLVELNSCDIAIHKDTLEFNNQKDLHHNNSVTEFATSSIPKMSDCKHHAIKSKDLIDKAVFNIVKIKTCSVLLEQLNMNSYAFAATKRELTKEVNSNVHSKKMSKTIDNTSQINFPTDNIANRCSDYDKVTCNNSNLNNNVNSQNNVLHRSATNFDLDSFNTHMQVEHVQYSQYKKDKLHQHGQALQNKLFQGSVRKKKISSKSDLTRHTSVHVRMRRYQCSQCDKNYGTKSTLKRHVQVHTERKRHHCFQCGKSFFRKDILERHKFIHARMKQYRCSHCEKSFSRKEALDKHKLVHNRIKYKI